MLANSLTSASSILLAELERFIDRMERVCVSQVSQSEHYFESILLGTSYIYEE